MILLALRHVIDGARAAPDLPALHAFLCDVEATYSGVLERDRTPVATFLKQFEDGDAGSLFLLFDWLQTHCGESPDERRSGQLRRVRGVIGRMLANIQQSEGRRGSTRRIFRDAVRTLNEIFWEDTLSLPDVMRIVLDAVTIAHAGRTLDTTEDGQHDSSYIGDLEEHPEQTTEENNARIQELIQGEGVNPTEEMIDAVTTGVRRERPRPDTVNNMTRLHRLREGRAQYALQYACSPAMLGEPVRLTCPGSIYSDIPERFNGVDLPAPAKAPAVTMMIDFGFTVACWEVMPERLNGIIAGAVPFEGFEWPIYTWNGITVEELSRP